MASAHHSRNASLSVMARWLIDGSGGPIHRNVAFNIHEGRFSPIRRMETTQRKALPELDFSDHTLLPCFVDSHVHLFMSATVDPAIRENQLKTDFDALRPVIQTHLNQHVAHGIIAVRDGGDRHGYARRYKTEWLDPSTSPISLCVTGWAWHRPGRYGRFVGKALPYKQAFKDALRANAHGIDQVKIINSGLNSLTEFGGTTSPQFTLEEMTEAVCAGHQLGLKTMVHANGKEPVRIALKAGCHSLEHGFFMGRENLKRMADSNTVWVPTAHTMQAYAIHLKENSVESAIARKNLDHQLEQIAEAGRLGVRIALGTDAGSLGVYHGSSVAEELKLLMRAGYGVEAAIQSASLHGAELLGLENAGIIADGRAANFIAVKGSPAELPDSLNRIEAIFVSGKRLKEADLS
ncbi:MAG: amidohydrolase family protein [Deltaproteobacteria bacterium]|nr:amidohydrolase family protein [Deltaproteobacteria bacterium]